MSTLSTQPPAPAKIRLPDYPRDEQELNFFFPDNETCAAYLDTLRWIPTNGFQCTACGSSKSWFARALRECAVCGKQYSVMSGTAFHGSKVALPRWFNAMWWFVTHRGFPRLPELRTLLAASNYEAARPLLAKLGAAIAYLDGVQGCTEIIEVEVAGHPIIIGARPKDNGGHTVRLHWFEKAGRMSLQAFVRGRLHAEGPYLPPRPYPSSREPGDGAAGPTEPPTSPVAPFPLKEFFYTLDRRLLVAPEMAPQHLQLVLNLHAFQYNHSHLSPGALWRAALLYALRPARGRGLPAWPPPCDSLA